MVHPNSLKNLTEHKSGRPKGFQLWYYIKLMRDWDTEQLDDVISNPKTTLNKLISAQYVLKATKGDTKVIEYLMDREEGKITQKIESNVNVHGLQSIGVDVTPTVTKVVCAVKDADSIKEQLTLDMNDKLLETND